jgi:hypothetical protein
VKTNWRSLTAGISVVSLLSLGSLNSIAQEVGLPTSQSPQRTTAPSGELSAVFPFCSWWIETSTTSTNIAFPDTNAAYWTTPFSLTGGDVTITGDYVDARYFSIQVYNEQGQLSSGSTSLADYEIAPANGSANPWVSGVYPADTPQSFSITISSQESTDLNVLSMPDTGTIGFIMLRVYIPDALPYPQTIFNATQAPAQTIPESFALISGHLPLMSVETANGVTELPTCSSTQGAALTQQTAQRGIAESATMITTLITAAKRSPITSGSKTKGDSTNPPRLQFFRTASSTTPFPNAESAYASAVYKVAPGEAVIVRAELPATPWNTAGTSWQGSNPVQWPANGDSSAYQLRYLSFCSYLDKPPYPVVSVEDGCATDTEIRTAMGGSNSAIAILTRVQERPTISEVGSNFIWLPAANSTADQVFAIRNMLASTSFAQSVTKVPAPEKGAVDPALTQSVMGEYYPIAYRCNIEVLKKVGPIKCRGKSTPTARD